MNDEEGDSKAKKTRRSESASLFLECAPRVGEGRGPCNLWL